MGFFAPRIPVRLREEIDRLAVRPLGSAEICRAIGEYAEEQGIRRPCYQQVRLLVREARQRPRSVSTAKVLLDVALRVHHPDVFLQHVSGTQTRFKRK
jgi:hypothetical protein